MDGDFFHDRAGARSNIPVRSIASAMALALAVASSIVWAPRLNESDSQRRVTCSFGGTGFLAVEFLKVTIPKSYND